MKRRGPGEIIEPAMSSPAAIDFRALCDQLDALLAAAPRRDQAWREEYERTLTDGYAGALCLEGERLRLERRIGEIAAQIREREEGSADELADLSLRLSRASGELKQLRARLAQLRQRAAA